jgi:hypothetical protein
MKKQLFISLGIILLPLFFVTNCTNKKEEAENYKKSIAEWRKQRLNNLKAEDGWLNLAGLFWLEEGDNTIGSAPGTDIQFPEKAPDKLGTFRLSEDKIRFIAAEGVAVTHDNEAIHSMDIQSDQKGNPTVLAHQSLKWHVIERSGQYAIRLRDLKSPLLEKLDSIPAFPVNPDWKIKATFIPFEEQKTIEVPNVLGNTYEEEIPGILRFTVHTKEYELYPLGTTERLFLIFGDETNAEETYGGGRFLSVEGPNENGITYIDFNKAYNPPCAFTPYATCPLPPRENILPVKIRAGEKSPDLEIPHH